MIFPNTPRYKGQGRACPDHVGLVRSALAMLGAVFPTTPRYATPPIPLDPEALASDPDEPIDLPPPGGGVERAAVPSGQDPLMVLIRRLFSMS